MKQAYISKTITKNENQGLVCQFFLTKRHNLKVFKGQIVFKFDLGLLNAYKLMYFDTYFDRNNIGNEDGKILGILSIVY